MQSLVKVVGTESVELRAGSSTVRIVARTISVITALMTSKIRKIKNSIHSFRRSNRRTAVTKTMKGRRKS